MVHRSTEEIFFKPRERQSGYRTVEDPPLLHSIVKELLSDRVREAVDKYIAEHGEAVQKAVTEALQRGVGECMIRALMVTTRRDLMNFEESVREAFNRMGLAI
jgi:hypothetical protein